MKTVVELAGLPGDWAWAVTWSKGRCVAKKVKIFRVDFQSRDPYYDTDKCGWKRATEIFGNYSAARRDVMRRNLGG